MDVKDLHWTTVLSISEIESKAKDFWVSKTMGGRSPSELDMFIAGFRIGVQETIKNPEVIAIIQNSIK